MDDLIGYSFDLSRASTGWVKWQGHAPLGSGTINLPQGGLGEQGVLFQDAMTDLFQDEQPHWIAFEDARAVSKQHGMVLFGLTMLLHMWCYHRGVPILGFSQPTVKKALTGSGRASKADMVGAAQARWPHLSIFSDDEADALGVGLAFWATQE